MKYFDYIVFDVDGTLADTEESVLSSLVQIVQEETSKTLPRHELDFALLTGNAESLVPSCRQL